MSNDKTTRLRDVGTGESVRVLRPAIGSGPAGMLNAAAISLVTDGVRYTLRGDTNVVLDVPFSRDG